MSTDRPKFYSILEGWWTPYWDNRYQEAFDIMKSAIAAEAINHYPDPNNPFDIYTDLSYYQMGACIMQEDKWITYWSRSLTDAQKNYNTMEKELLAVVTCIKEYYNMLYSVIINVYTDHKNLILRPYLNSEYVAGDSGLKTTTSRYDT